MSGIEMDDGVLTVDREPNRLDELAIDVSRVLSGLGVDHAFVAGCVAILAGRSRATEHIDVILEPLAASTAEALADDLATENFPGSTMPLSDRHGMLADGNNIRVAREGTVIPNVELKYASDEFDRASIGHAITARIGDASLPIGPLELRIAYKLFLDTRKDFEDAVHPGRCSRKVFVPRRSKTGSTDSTCTGRMNNATEPGPSKERRNRAERLAEIRRWVASVQSTPAAVWGTSSTR